MFMVDIGFFFFWFVVFFSCDIFVWFWYYGNVASQNAFTEVFPLLLSSEKGYRELISFLNVGSIH